MSRIARILCAIGSILLLVMAIFHGSGHSMVSESITASNAPAFLKHIVPALFFHASMHLVGLAAFGILALFNGSRGMVALLAIVVLADAALAFYLGGALQRSCSLWRRCSLPLPLFSDSMQATDAQP